MADKKDENIKEVRCPSAYVESDMSRTSDPCFDGKNMTTFAANAKRLKEKENTYITEVPKPTIPKAAAAIAPSSVSETAADIGGIAIDVDTGISTKIITTTEKPVETDEPNPISEIGIIDKADKKIITPEEILESADDKEKDF